MFCFWLGWGGRLFFGESLLCVGLVEVLVYSSFWIFGIVGVGVRSVVVLVFFAFFLVLVYCDLFFVSLVEIGGFRVYIFIYK